MVKQIFINLPVSNLKKSMSFFTKLGFKFNKQFTDKNAACMIIGNNIYSMLIVKKRFNDFTKKGIINARKNVEVINSLQLSTKKEVDAITLKAKKAGALLTKSSDYGWMYQKGFEDPDGHLWEVFWMNPKGIPKN